MRCNIRSVKSTLRSVRPLNDPYGSNELNKPLTDRYNAGVLDNPQKLPGQMQDSLRQSPLGDSEGILPKEILKLRSLDILRPSQHVIMSHLF